MNTIKVLDYTFHGPFSTLSNIENKMGVFVIHDYYDGKYFLKDVDFAIDLNKDIPNHRRSKCWEKEKKGHLLISIYYLIDLEKCVTMSKEIWNEFTPICR